MLLECFYVCHFKQWKLYPYTVIEFPSNKPEAAQKVKLNFFPQLNNMAFTGLHLL